MTPRIITLLLLASLATLRAQSTALPSPAETRSTSSSSAASLMNSMEVLNDETKLKSGDLVSYRVIEQQDDPVILHVTDTGEIEVPLLGRFPVAGKTCRQLAVELKPLLEKDYFYKATVIIGVDTLSTQSRGRVFLTGQVRTQGAIEIPANEVLTVSKAVLLNGGLADFANRRKVKLIHKKADGTSETTVVDLVEVLDKGHSEKDAVVQPGDTISVPEKLINF